MTDSPLSDQDLALPPCHDRPSPEEMKSYEEAMQCDLNGDRRITTAEERDCLDAQNKRKQSQKAAPAQNAR